MLDGCYIAAKDFEYHSSGAVTRYRSGNDILHELNYDANRYWVRSIRTGQLFTPRYDDYDAVGNVRRISDSRSGANGDRDQIFTYDALERLTDARPPDAPVGPPQYPPIHYEHDAHGNRATTANTTYEYQPGTLQRWRQTSGGVTREFDYDNNGNTVRELNRHEYSYTPFNMLRTVRQGGVETARYTYDADNWRVQKSAGPNTMFYVRGPNNELLAEWTNPESTSSRFRDYIYAGARLIAVVKQ